MCVNVKICHDAYVLCVFPAFPLPPVDCGGDHEQMNRYGMESVFCQKNRETLSLNMTSLIELIPIHFTCFNKNLIYLCLIMLENLHYFYISQVFIYCFRQDILLKCKTKILINKVIFALWCKCI